MLTLVIVAAADVKCFIAAKFSMQSLHVMLGRSGLSLWGKLCRLLVIAVKSSKTVESLKCRVIYIILVAVLLLIYFVSGLPVVTGCSSLFI